jgi:hypothetical protein
MHGDMSGAQDNLMQLKKYLTRHMDAENDILEKILFFSVYSIMSLKMRKKAKS